MTINKHKLIEISILLILLIILVFASYLTYYIINDKPSLTTKDNTSYEITKYYKYKNNFSTLNKFQIPYLESMLENGSKYETTLKSTDGNLKYYEENITIRYPSTSLHFKEIENFCNSYNEIEHEYEFICTFNINKINIKNTYNLEELKTSTIITKKKNITLTHYLNEKIDAIKKSIELEEIQNK